MWWRFILKVGKGVNCSLCGYVIDMLPVNPHCFTASWWLQRSGIGQLAIIVKVPYQDRGYGSRCNSLFHPQRQRDDRIQHRIMGTFESSNFPITYSCCATVGLLACCCGLIKLSGCPEPIQDS